jgi:hypothetical protein
MAGSRGIEALDAQKDSRVEAPSALRLHRRHDLFKDSS